MTATQRASSGTVESTITSTGRPCSATVWGMNPKFPGKCAEEASGRFSRRAPKVRSKLNYSIVDVSFSVSTTGSVRDVIILAEEDEENANVLSRLRRAVRFSKFRPRIESGRPIHSEGHVFRYRYWY